MKTHAVGSAAGWAQSLLLAVTLALLPWLLVADPHSVGALAFVAGLACCILSLLAAGGQRLAQKPRRWWVTGLWLGAIVIVILGIQNPFSATQIGRETDLQVLVSTPPWAALPAAANASLAAMRFWSLSGGLLLALSLVWMPRERLRWRLILWGFVVSAAAVAAAGSYYKLQGAELLLGHYPKGHGFFFSVFQYPNHYVLYAALSLMACAALFKDALHHARVWPPYKVWLILALSTLLAVILAFSLPLTRSRSAMIILFLLGGILLARNVYLRVRTYQQRRAAALIPLWVKALAGVGVVLVLTAAVFLGRTFLAERWGDTKRQLAGMEDGWAPDLRLYMARDTARMWWERPVWGWGLGGFEEAYPRVAGEEFFAQRYQHHSRNFGKLIPVEYAHQDWLQYLAELGLVGMALLTGGFVVLYRARSRQCLHPASLWLERGCGLVLIFSMMDYHLQNPALWIHFCVCYALACALSGKPDHQAPTALNEMT